MLIYCILIPNWAKSQENSIITWLRASWVCVNSPFSQTQFQGEGLLHWFSFLYRPDLIISHLPSVSYLHAPECAEPPMWSYIRCVIFHVCSLGFCTFVTRGFEPWKICEIFNCLSPVWASLIFFSCFTRLLPHPKGLCSRRDLATKELKDIISLLPS